MSTIHTFGLVRFSKKTGKIDKSLTGLGSALLQLWALQNTTPGKACLLFDLTTGKPVKEFLGDRSGFPKMINDPAEFHFDFPPELIIELRQDAPKHNCS